ncbi:MAG: periplasmic heavy metal sensor [Candidatus Omnitrophica bacterium]|nr:periplasmic heavy metal sensor [Candidatus Omnitrophota bacterium]
MTFSWKISWHQVAISIVIGFLVGAFYGQLSGRPHFPKPGEHGRMKAKMVEHLSKDLNLTAEQKTQVEGIFEAKHPQMLALQAEIQPKFEALRRATDAEIRQILNPDQQKKFDEIKAKMEERHKKHGDKLMPPCPRD